MIVYPWHPFFAMTVQISHNRRGKKLITIHTEIKPGYSREAPPWMLDPSFCARMSKGPPEVNMERPERALDLAGFPSQALAGIEIRAKVRPGLLLVGVSRCSFGSGFRLNRNQLFYGLDFAIDEDDV
jgi:hypothetical protein